MKPLLTHELHLFLDLGIHVHQQERPVPEILGHKTVRTEGISPRSISPENALFHVLVGVGVGEDELAEFSGDAEERVGFEASGTSGFGFGELGATKFGVECGFWMTIWVFFALAIGFGFGVDFELVGAMVCV